MIRAPARRSYSQNPYRANGASGETENSFHGRNLSHLESVKFMGLRTPNEQLSGPGRNMPVKPNKKNLRVRSSHISRRRMLRFCRLARRRGDPLVVLKLSYPKPYCGHITWYMERYVGYVYGF